MNKQTTDKLLNLKRIICACENLRSEEREAFSGIVDEIIYSCTPVVRGKFDIYKFASSDPSRGVLSGVFYDKGNVVASDGKLLAAIRQDYPGEREGLVIDKNGCTIEGRYPNYSRVIPETEGWPSYTIDFQKAREIIRRSKAWAKLRGLKQNCKSRFIKIGPACFMLNKLENFLAAMEYIGADGLQIKDGTTAAVCKNDKGTLLIMPFIEPECTEDVFIETLI